MEVTELQHYRLLFLQFLKWYRKINNLVPVNLYIVHSGPTRFIGTLHRRGSDSPQVHQKNMFFKLEKDFGDDMALVEMGEKKAVLILTDRVETNGPFLSLPNDPRPYPVIRFEQPPELCGVVEPAQPQAYLEL